jgi:hypothetical protein
VKQLNKDKFVKELQRELMDKAASVKMVATVPLSGQSKLVVEIMAGVVSAVFEGVAQCAARAETASLEGEES